MLYIIYHKTDYIDYIFNGITDRSSVSFIVLNDECNLLQRIIRKIFPNLLLFPSLILGKRLRSILKKLNESDEILIIDYSNKNIIHSIYSIVSSGVKKYLWFWNALNAKNKIALKNHLEYIKKCKYDVLTFDKHDALKYDLKLKNQFYRMHQEEDNLHIAFDFYFLGYLKTRGHYIEQLQMTLKDYRTLFIVVNDSRNYIKYIENIENIKKTKCIVELVKEGQNGLTLRALEALAFRKKLITNNIEILNEKFYHPNNIFIIGIDNYKNLDTFLDKKYHIINSSIIKEYDINHWIGDLSEFKC